MASPYKEAVLATSGLVSLWPLDESSGNALDGKGSNNGLPKNEAGLTRAQTSLLPNGEGKSCKFTSASSGYFELPDTASLDVGDVFSIEAWVKPNASASDRQIFGGPTNGPTLWLFGTTEILDLSKRATASLVRSSSGISTAAASHVVATKNGETRKMYVNGVDVSSLIGNATVEKPAGAYYLGKDGPGTNYFNGTMQFVGLYSADLSKATVEAHYAAGLLSTSANSSRMLMQLG